MEFCEVLELEIPRNHKYLPEELDAALGFAHIALALSYFKLTAPKEIKVKTSYLTAAEIEFWRTTWLQGLGEYFYVNNLDFRGLINFTNCLEPTAQTSDRKDARSGTLLGLGGGKDSLVSASLLQKANEEFTPWIMGNNQIALRQAQKLGIEPVMIKRQIDPKLIELSKTGNYYNGHVPFSLILAAMGQLAAVLGGYANLIVSNERSADYGNTEFLGEMVNHQWSKSFEAEKLINQETQKLGINYFSLMRPFWELKIVEMFTKLYQGKKFWLQNFASCNRNFTQKKSELEGLWCQKCPKCAFVFALFSAFLNREELVAIFGSNLFTDQQLIKVFKELWGEGIKPLECVGEALEVEAALALFLEDRPILPREVVLKKFVEKRSQPQLAKLKSKGQKLLEDFASHQIPEKYSQILPLDK
jgi:hypothetical protein